MTGGEQMDGQIDPRRNETATQLTRKLGTFFKNKKKLSLSYLALAFRCISTHFPMAVTAAAANMEKGWPSYVPTYDKLLFGVNK